MYIHTFIYIYIMYTYIYIYIFICFYIILLYVSEISFLAPFTGLLRERDVGISSSENGGTSKRTVEFTMENLDLKRMIWEDMGASHKWVYHGVPLQSFIDIDSDFRETIQLLAYHLWVYPHVENQESRFISPKLWAKKHPALVWLVAHPTLRFVGPIPDVISVD